MFLPALLQKIRPIELAELIKKLCGITYRDYAVGDLRLSLDPASNYGYRLLTQGWYEPEQSKAVEQLLRPGDIFVDVGANEGWFSLLAARTVKHEGRVFAIEPQQRLWAVLLRNLWLNKICNVTLLPYAVGSTEGTIELALHPTLNPGATTAVIDWRRRHLRRQKAALTTLDFLATAAGWRRIRMAKIDVEGYEIEVLRGADRLLAERRIEYVLIEVHPGQIRTMGRQPHEISDFLRNHGYKEMSEYPECWTALP